MQSSQVLPWGFKGNFVNRMKLSICANGIALLAELRKNVYLFGGYGANQLQVKFDTEYGAKGNQCFTEQNQSKTNNAIENSFGKSRSVTRNMIIREPF
ncbi:MAG: hypothetical protein FD163_834 [Hyphomonadaceae bacterium]|nr:MAG: hypothetical protein FD128_2369 [Hyphomonadaceae bacterium]KAF0186166.1 MAG: hypothetical protein FD163_834 [Hyphomonadaceae bacterium]